MPPGWEEAATLPDFAPFPVEPAPGTGTSSLIAGLESGWVMLPKAVIGGAGEAPVTIDVVLLHPARGVALLETPPHWTPDAPARLRRRLAQARFAAIFPGTLPVVHARLQRGALSDLPQLLAKGFAALPPLDLPGGDAWMAAVRRALLAPADAPGTAEGGRRRGRLLGAAGLVLASALGGVFLAQRPSAPPPREQAAAPALPDPPRLLERLASGVVVTAEASAAPTLAEAERLPGPLPLPDEAPPEDARAVEFAEVSPPAAPPQPPMPPDLLATPVVPPLPAAPPDPPAIAVPPGLEPHLAVQPAPVREAAAPPARPAPEPVAPTVTRPPAAAPVTAKPTAPTPVVAKPAEPAPARRPQADPTTLAALLRRGDALLALGDVSGARRFYERAAEAGSAAGARAAGRTHDPAVLAGLGVRGIRPDPEAAAAWYRRAEALAAQERP